MDKKIDIDTIKVIANEYIDKALERYTNTVCDLKHKEVSEMKEHLNHIEEDVEKLYRIINGKFTRLTIAIIVTLLALVGNLILKLI